MKNLSDKGILVKFSTRCWTGYKEDRKISADIKVKNNAKKAGKYRKPLIDDAELKVVMNKGREGRDFVYCKSLPWGEDGTRILLASEYLKFIEEYRQFRYGFEEAVQKFIVAYPDRVKEAPSLLGTLYNEKDYPSVQEIASKFEIKLETEPIANLDDFRLHGTEIDMDELRLSVQELFEERLVGATQDIWNRIQEKLGILVERLKSPDKQFKKALIDNIQDLIVLLPGLNITNDPQIIQAVESMKSLVVDPQSIRDNPKIRAQKASEAQVILDRFNDYMAA